METEATEVRGLTIRRSEYVSPVILFIEKGALEKPG